MLPKVDQWIKCTFILIISPSIPVSPSNMLEEMFRKCLALNSSKKKKQLLMCVYAYLCPAQLLWTLSHQAPISMGFPRREY